MNYFLYLYNNKELVNSATALHIHTLASQAQWDHEDDMTVPARLLHINWITISVMVGKDCSLAILRSTISIKLYTPMAHRWAALGVMTQPHAQHQTSNHPV